MSASQQQISELAAHAAALSDQQVQEQASLDEAILDGQAAQNLERSRDFKRYRDALTRELAKLIRGFAMTEDERGNLRYIQGSVCELLFVLRFTDTLLERAQKALEARQAESERRAAGAEE